MTKAKTKGERRRGKKARGGRPAIDAPREAATASYPRGRPVRPTAALRQALVTRARLAGIDLPLGEDGKPKLTADLHRRLSQPWMGCNAGRAIEPMASEERSRLWGAISDIRRAYARYWRALGIPDPYPPAARLLYAETPPEDGAPVSDAPWAREPLSPEEEVKAATSAMMACEMALGAARWVKGCILFDEPLRDREALLACLRTRAA